MLSGFFVDEAEQQSRYQVDSHRAMLINDHSHKYLLKR
jgi:hypothetical protein